MENLTTPASTPLLCHNSFIIIILFIAHLVILTAGLLANVLVIVTLLKTPKMKTATNYFILNLAVADLLAVIICLSPSHISNVYVSWVLGSLMCKVVPYVQGVAICASVYSLAAISGERLMTIWYPLRRQVTKNAAQRIVSWIWIWAAGLALPRLIYSDLGHSDMSSTFLVFCVESWPSEMSGNIYFILVNLGLYFIFPLGFISFCHFKIWLRIRQHIAATDLSASQMELFQQRARACVHKMIILVFASFSECWLHLFVIIVRIKLIPAVLGTVEEQVLEYALPIAQIFGAANSCINPIFYAFSSRSFRFAIQRLIAPSVCTKTATLRTNLLRARLNATFNRICRRSSQLKNDCHNAVELGELNVVMLSHNNIKLATISRSQSCQF